MSLRNYPEKCSEVLAGHSQPPTDHVLSCQGSSSRFNGKEMVLRGFSRAMYGSLRGFRESLSRFRRLLKRFQEIPKGMWEFWSRFQRFLKHYTGSSVRSKGLLESIQGFFVPRSKTNWQRNQKYSSRCIFLCKWKTLWILAAGLLGRVSCSSSLNCIDHCELYIKSRLHLGDPENMFFFIRKTPTAARGSRWRETEKSGIPWRTRTRYIEGGTENPPRRVLRTPTGSPPGHVMIQQLTVQSCFFHHLYIKELQSMSAHARSPRDLSCYTAGVCGQSRTADLYSHPSFSLLLYFISLFSEAGVRRWSDSALPFHPPLNPHSGVNVRPPPPTQADVLHVVFTLTGTQKGHSPVWQRRKRPRPDASVIMSSLSASCSSFIHTVRWSLLRLIIGAQWSSADNYPENMRWIQYLSSNNRHINWAPNKLWILLRRVYLLLLQ